MFSTAASHTPLITPDLFERAQTRARARRSNTTARAPRRSTRPYLFCGLLYCGLCGRVMQGNFTHGRIYYRCKASRDYVRQHHIEHPPALYLREDAISEPIGRLLQKELGQRNLSSTLKALVQAQHRLATAQDKRQDDQQLRQTVEECEEKLKQYRAALEAGADAMMVASWMKEVTTIKANAETLLKAAPPAAARLTEDDINKMVDRLGGMMRLLETAAPRDRAELYARIGLRLTYHPGRQTTTAEVQSPVVDRGLNVCPRGDLNPHALYGH